VTPHSDVPAILAGFGFGPGVSAEPEPGGHINASFRVEGVGPVGEGPYLLQRLNPEAFPDGDAVMSNVANVSAHLERAVRAAQLPEPERRVLRLVPATSGEAAIRGPDGALWRLLGYIHRARPAAQPGSTSEARAVGHAFGLFHRLMGSYDGPALIETLPGFHDTRRHFAAFEEHVRLDRRGRLGEAREEVRALLSRREVGDRLVAVPLPRRIAHNDAKASNVLLDLTTGADLAVIDLDTVMPGSLLHDVGDLIRSVSCTTREDERDSAAARVDRTLFAALAGGFLAGLGEMRLTPQEEELWLPAGIVLTYEQALRFLGDYLAGDVYYRTTRARQNLDRARVQLRLLESLESDRSALEGEVRRALRATT
jgi:Ser/Thr protein kinase RdoA (MazF antagonist)